VGRRAHAILSRTIGYLIGEDGIQNIRYRSIRTKDVSVSYWNPSTAEQEFTIKVNDKEYNTRNI
jgi:hypothetical protein